MSNGLISRFFSRTIFNFSLRRHPFKYRALDVLLGLRAPRRVQRKEKKSQHVFYSKITAQVLRCCVSRTAVPALKLDKFLRFMWRVTPSPS